QAVDALPLLPESERRLLLDEWSRSGGAAEPAVRCVHELFAEQAERTPEAVALVFQDESVTYAELDRRSDALARRLAALGAGPEVRAGICVERGVEMVVGLLGILKAGGAYVPLDPQYPAERLAYMLADAGATLLLTQERLRERLPAFGGEVVLLDGGDGGTVDDARVGGSPALRAASPENLAYVIYTSGSTGLPKGTEVPHRAIPGFFRGAEYARFGEGAVVLQHASISWDVLTLELWPAVLSGGTCVLYPGQTSEPGLLGEQVRRHGVNTLWLTAAYFNLIVDTAPEILEGVAQVMTGGEAVSVPHVRRALELYPRLRLVNGYGPSETTVFATCHPVPAGFDAPSLPVGRPVGDRRVYLLDRHFRAVPLGAAGEVCIGGPAVARGYLGRPGLTAERFVPDPFGEPGARLYRSGDRARWRAEGELEFAGRVDFQVKIRGFRVEPGEVEAVLRARPGVREATVVVREDVPGEKRLVAYVVGEVEAEALREHLRRTLPEYMVPSAFVFLDALPLTPNGKLDRKALPAPELASPEEAYVAPRTPAEEVLAGIWAEVLRLERVGAEDSFFDLGGHSLLATRVAARVLQAFGVELPLRAVFERPVLSGLAAEIERLRGTGAAAGEGAIAPAAREGDLPVTFAQERLWFVDALDPGSPVYAIPFSYHIAGRLDHDALRRALTELVRRHEPLRTALPAVDGVPVQRIAPPPADFDLPVADLRHLPEGERRAEAGRLAAEASQHRFDLARGPLFRASLVHVADAEHHLLLNLHHAVGDGWSVGVLLEELSALYGAFSRGEPSPLPEPALQYADYAAWQREQLAGEALERQLSYWRRALDGAPALLELPADRPRPPVESHRGAVEWLVVPPGLTAEVNALARREGATLFMVLLSALDVVLGRLAGQEDVVVGTPIAGRTRVETDRMVGLFLNSLALRTDLSGDPSFRELLGRVRETTLAAYAHQDLPFERVLEEVRPERSLAHAPVFQVMLNLANFEEGDFRAEG
ncbi:MAG TPA: amino acid adenylation domain-containing protein, partial [Longimicrobium sp.]|nr:amino acid adenylation domain-containing protein [Longimicrobium sp.]